MNKETIQYYIRTYETHKKAIFNPYDNIKNDSFVFDFATNKKIILNSKPREYVIFDISADGKFVLFTIKTTHQKDRMLYMKNIETNEIIFQLNDFFVYEARFTPSKTLLLCRGNINKMSKLFVYNLLDRKIAYSFPYDVPMEYGCFNYEENIFCIPDVNKKSTAYSFNFDRLTSNELFFEECAFIQRMSHYKENSYIMVDSRFTCLFYKNGVPRWITKLEIGTTNYAPPFHPIPKIDKLLFETIDTSKKNSGGFSDHRDSILLLSMKDGGVGNVMIPQEDPMHDIAPFYDSSIIDSRGKIFDIKARKMSYFPVDKYR